MIPSAVKPRKDDSVCIYINGVCVGGGWIHNERICSRKQANEGGKKEIQMILLLLIMCPPLGLS